MQRLMNDPGHIDAVLKDGAERARAIADPVMQDVRRIIGFIRLIETQFGLLLVWNYSRKTLY
jgi:uncharacterized membrane protein